MSTTDQKLDDLARTVVQGFSEVREEIGTLREEMGTLREEMGTLHEEMGTLREEMGTLHEEMGTLREEMATKADLKRLKEDVDVMLDRHIGTFRKDYDELAARVKKLEELVLSR